ncbi:hypothetical protein VE00_07877 [Pseudogymnoascus sp. WSF 3629]|nr:hypothetical protein VE00_07877 [Pseudogymnoascus sp. WSF 3629]
MEKPITIKVLMIHGHGQSGPLLDIKTSRLQHALREAFTNHTRTCEVRFCFPTAPCRILVPSLREPKESPTEGQLESLDMWTWCMDYSSGGNKFFDENKTISDLDNALDSIAEIIRQYGPFDGVIGFSSGACIAALIASLLEEGRKQAFEKWESKNGMPYPNSFLREGKSDGKHNVLQSPLKFAVCYSGFSLEHPKYSAFYQPQIQTPILHVLDKCSYAEIVSELNARTPPDFNQNHYRPLTSDTNQQLREELIPDYTIDLSDAAASRKDVVVTELQSLIAMFRRRERKLLYGKVQNETAESVGQTATTMETILQLISELIASHVQTQGKLLPQHSKVLERENVALLGTTQRLRESRAYMAGQIDQICAENKRVWAHNSELNDKWIASEIENSELRKKNEALTTELHVYKAVTGSHHSEALSNDGNGGKRGRDVAESELHVNVSASGAAKKRSKFE